VPAQALGALQSRMQVRRYAAGEVVLRAGAPSAELFGLIDGAVRIDLVSRRVLLVPPQCFGELSALTGDPVSASVVAQRDATAWVLSAQTLFEVLGHESAFFRNVATLLGQRLRERTHRTRAVRPRVALLASHDALLAAALSKGLQHYAPGSEHASDAQRLDAWRDEAPSGAVLLLQCEDAAALVPLLEAHDALLAPEAELHRFAPTPAALIALDDGTPAQRWRHAPPRDEIEAAAAAQRWSRERLPAIDHLVRRLCGREVGVAMSVGAAAGLAHLGVLQELEADGLPLDYLCGSSMGGAVGLALARFGSARVAADAILQLVAEFARDKGLQWWWPRASLVSEARMTAITHKLFGDTTFAQLRKPAAVVAADLAQGRRQVIDSGPIAPAARASAAIPGVFAPVRLGDAVLVDGGVVSRVPVDVLLARDCGFKLAVLARPDYGSAADAAKAADRLEQRLRRPLGLRASLGGAWRLLGWWDAAAQAERADFLLSVATPIGEGFNFAAAEAMVERGRQAAQARLPQIRAAMEQVLAPGTP